MLIPAVTEPDFPGSRAIDTAVLDTPAAVYIEQDAWSQNRRSYFCDRQGQAHSVPVAGDPPS